MISKNVLIVGAGGFVGGFITAECLRRGWQVYAGVRASTSRRFLTDSRINFITFDFDSAENIQATLQACSVKFDYIIYNLGLTKAVSFYEFSRVNHDILRDFLTGMKGAGVVPEKLLYISSLSVMGKGDERGFRPFRPEDIPSPDTRYGASKLKAEMLLASSGVPYIIFRCTGVYGPHEQDYFLMFKSIASGVDFSVGYRKQMLTFIYVEDLARAVCDALAKAPVGNTYLISEPRGYTQAEFRKLAAEALGKRHVLPVKAPLWVLKLVCSASGYLSRIKGKASTLNPDKYRILKQRNWLADVSKAEQDFGFAPQIDLAEGCKRAVTWYRQAGWLKQSK